MTHQEQIEENNRQIVELKKIVAAESKIDRSSPKVRNAKRMIRDLQDDTDWRLIEMAQ